MLTCEKYAVAENNDTTVLQQRSMQNEEYI